MGKRTAEFVLGLLGGIFGFFGAFFALTFGAIDTAFSGTSSSVTGLGWSALLFSILGIIGAALVKSKKVKLAGWLMVIAAVGGVISISFFYILPGLLLLIGGLMALLRKEQK